MKLGKTKRRPRARANDGPLTNPIADSTSFLFLNRHFGQGTGDRD